MMVITEDRYQQQFLDKQQRLRVLFNTFEIPNLELFDSPIQNFRMRSEFRVWHEGEDLFYIMFDPQTKQRIRTDQHPIASVAINQLMPKLIALLKQHHELRHQLFQVDFLSTLSGEMLVSLLYHRALTTQWRDLINHVRQQLAQEGMIVDIVGRAHKTKIVLDKDYVEEQLQVNGRAYRYRQVENSFTQPNGYVAQKMLAWAEHCTQDCKGDLLELYCGNGHFSIALAHNFNQVLATELAKSSVYAAQYNIEVNHITNLKIVRMSADEFSDAIMGTRPYYRLRDINLNSYQCDTILVDPPRSGLDDKTLAMVQHYQNILYISCNPDTLINNLRILRKTHHIKRLALFDQFPYTHHIETGVWLQMKS